MVHSNTCALAGDTDGNWHKTAATKITNARIISPPLKIQAGTSLHRGLACSQEILGDCDGLSSSNAMETLQKLVIFVYFLRAWRSFEVFDYGQPTY
ncbi:MAG: hypothetical protein AAF393_07200 [Pseudomonadota bacterium]